VSDPEYNAARRAKGLRAVAQGLNINLDLEVAIVCLNHAADKIEELEREQDELKKQLIDAKSSTAFWMGKYNNAIQLRGEDPLCDSFWKTLDKLSAERALADRLAEAIRKHRDELELTSGDSVDRILWNVLDAVEGGQP
jgi:hypothetical protein